MRMKRWGDSRPNRAMNIILCLPLTETGAFAHYPGPRGPDGPDVPDGPDGEDDEFVILQEDGVEFCPSAKSLWCELPENINWPPRSTDKRHAEKRDERYVEKRDERYVEKRDELGEGIKQLTEQRQENNEIIKILKGERTLSGCRARLLTAKIAVLEASQDVIDEETKIKLSELDRKKKQQ